jgi:hypothetical protein
MVSILDEASNSPTGSPEFKFSKKEKIQPIKPKIEILGEDAALGKNGKKFEAIPFFTCPCKICDLQIKNGHSYEVHIARNLSLFKHS